jgi:group I intron endonuclease
MNGIRCGIYAVVNTVTGRAYVGGSENIPGRWSHHKWALRRGMHHNAEFQTDWNNLGAAKFKFAVLTECPSSALRDEERRAIADAASASGVYNAYLQATPLGHKHSEEVCARRSETLTGRPCSDDTRAKMAAWKRSDQLRAKLSAALSGRPKSPEHRAAIAAALRGRKIGPQSPETIAKRIAATARTKAMRATP